MLLDPNTRRNLELTESLRGKGKKGTLLSLLDKTCTAMGGRLLRSWVEQPLTDREEINRRLDAVEEMTKNRMTGITLAEELEGVYDLERLLSKVSYRSLNARDCLALCASFKRIPEIRNLIAELESSEMTAIREELDPMEDLTALLESAIHPDAPIQITEGGIIRDGYSGILDEYREAQKNGRQWILELEAKERDATGIRNLTCGFSTTRFSGTTLKLPRAF